MVAMVTGATDGIGRATAKLLAHRGYRVYGVSRTPARVPYLRHIAADVSRRDDVLRAVETVMDREGRIDLLVCCAGTSLASPAEVTDPRDARYLFDVNVWGCVDAACAVLPHMKRAGRGRIVLVSSMTGLFPVPYLSFYSSSKAALLAWAAALDGEARPFGVRVCAVLPGGVRTQFTDKRKKYWDMVGDARAPGLGQAIRAIGTEEQTGLHPGQVAGEILRLARCPHPPVLAPVGGAYKLYCLLQRALPQRAVLLALRWKYTKSGPMGAAQSTQIPPRKNCTNSTNAIKYGS